MIKNNSNLDYIPEDVEYYKSNRKLLAANYDWSYTKEQLEEIIKCSEDPIYFVETYMKIIHVDKGVVPFDMWDFQKHYLEVLHENRNTIAKWPRQSGKCYLKDTKYRIKNKKTNEILELTAEQFHSRIKNA